MGNTMCLEKHLGEKTALITWIPPYRSEIMIMVIGVFYTNQKCDNGGHSIGT